MSRFDKIDIALDDMTPRQREIHDAIASGPRGRVPDLFKAYLQAPELADRQQKLGAHLRYDTSLTPRLSELAIICVARYWNSRYEWYWHCREALEGGVPRQEVEAIAANRRPDFEDDTAETVYTFATELLQKKAVSDETFEQAVDHLGVPGTVELTALIGNYQSVAGILSVFEIPLPGPAEIELQV